MTTASPTSTPLVQQLRCILWLDRIIPLMGWTAIAGSGRRR